MKQDIYAKVPRQPFSVTIAVLFLVSLLSPRWQGVFFPMFQNGVTFDLSQFISLAACGAGAAWLFYTVGWGAGFLVAIPSFFVGYLSTHSLLYACGSLVFLPLGLALALVSQKRIPRATAVTVSSLFLVLCLGLSLLLPVLSSSGSFSLDALKTYYATFFDDLRQVMKEAFTVEVAGRNVPFFTTNNAEAYINTIISLMPGLLALYMILLSFVGGLLYRALLSLTHCPSPDDKNWRLSPSPVSAVFYLLVFLICAILPSDAFIWMVSANLVLILAPFFLIAGLSSVFEKRIIDGYFRPRILRGIVLFLSLFTGILGPLLVSLFFGLYDSIRAIFPSRQTPKQG